jgi:hypothetical protein
MEPAAALPNEPATSLAESPVQPGPVPFVLPTARQVVGRGFDLGLATSRQIQRASIYVGLLATAFVVPLVIQAAAMVIAMPDLFSELFDAGSGAGLVEPGPLSLADPGLIALLWVVVLLASAAITALMIDAQVMAVALLGGQLAGRPLRIHEALRRARQVFWRMVMVWFLVSLPLAVIQSLLADPLVEAGIPEEGVLLLVALVVAMIGAPFGYVPAGIILGDVEPGQAVVRSVRLARARWRLAAVIALFATVFAWIEVLALGVGIDVLARLGETVHLGFDNGLTTTATLVVLLAGVAAGVSLLFTFGALIAAPQVVAFVGLTHFHAGLDRARDPALPHGPELQAPAAEVIPPVGAGLAPEPERPTATSTAPASEWTTVSARSARFRWVTLPMATILALELALAMVALIGVVSPPA